MKSIVKFGKHSNPQKHINSEIFEKHMDFFFGKSEKHSDLLCSRTLCSSEGSGACGSYYKHHQLNSVFRNFSGALKKERKKLKGESKSGNPQDILTSSAALAKSMSIPSTGMC